MGRAVKDAEQLPALKTVDRADVYSAGLRAATLTRTPDGVCFAYLPAYVAAGGRAVATTLPPTMPSITRPGGALPPFFTNLLPEGRRLGALTRAVKTSADDELSLLLALGTDTVGDVQVVPEGIAPEQVSPRLVVREFSEIRFRDLLQDLGVRIDRAALPGIQDKTSTAMLNLPVARRGARFILKLNPPEFPHLVENEACFLAAARLSGLRVAQAQVVHDADGASGLLVERFDRVRPLGPDDAPGTLAVEDACQVLGLPPADKYRASAEDVVTGLARVCQAPLPAARTFLAQLVFAYLSGNGDAHAKNFAVLRGSDGEWRPSPAYDLPSSYVYGDTTMALSVAGRTSSDLGGKDFRALAAAAALPDRAATKIIAEQVERVDSWLTLLDDLPFDGGRLTKLKRVVKHRQARLLS